MIRVRKDESPSFFVQKQKNQLKIAKNKLTKFRFMAIIKLQNKISYKTKVKK